LDPLFEVHKLNELGLKKAHEIAFLFNDTLKKLKSYVPEGRELAITKTHLESACFFAKKAMSNDPVNQEPE